MLEQSEQPVINVLQRVHVPLFGVYLVVEHLVQTEGDSHSAQLEIEEQATHFPLPEFK